MLLKLSTWQEVERYLEHSKSIIIPIGSTEQHGPNGLIGTDAICPETIAYKIAEDIDVLIAPTINFGMAQHHLGFPGSMSLRPTTLIAIVQDLVQSLAIHGFSHFYFLNGHGGNVATVTAAFSEIYAQTSFAGSASESKIQCKLMNWWSTAAIHKLSKELFGDTEGYHATPSEVSLTFCAYPNAVKYMASKGLAPVGEIYDAQRFRQKFPDGRIGSDPSFATVEAGERILQVASAEIKQDYLKFCQR